MDVIKLGKESGLHRHQHNLMSNPIQVRFSYDGYEENLIRFATLVRAEALEEAAKVLDDAIKHDWNIPHKPALVNCAAAIRGLK